jgi:hypothetical protein
MRGPWPTGVKLLCHDLALRLPLLRPAVLQPLGPAMTSRTNNVCRSHPVPKSSDPCRADDRHTPTGLRGIPKSSEFRDGVTRRERAKQASFRPENSHPTLSTAWRRNTLRHRTYACCELLQTLIAAELVDEYRVWIFPLVLGKGKRLFENGVPPRGLSLIATRSTPSGVLLNSYRPAGPPRCNSARTMPLRRCS